MRIDKTARQKGTPSWLKELLYVDEVGDDAKPTDKSDASGEGDARDGESPKANAGRPTNRTDEPKEIATDSSKPDDPTKASAEASIEPGCPSETTKKHPDDFSEAFEAPKNHFEGHGRSSTRPTAEKPNEPDGNALGKPAETRSNNLAACGDELETATEGEYDHILFSLRRFAGKASSTVAKTLDQLFLGLMDRSMGETNFFVVTMMGLACTKVISAQFFEAEAFGELNLLAFLIAICTAAACAASKKLPANPLAALCISVLPAFIETAAICMVRGLSFSEEYTLIAGLALVCAVGGFFLGIAQYFADDTDPNEALKRAVIGAIWGFAIGATAAIIAEAAPVMADTLANRDIPTFLEQLLAAH